MNIKKTLVLLVFILGTFFPLQSQDYTNTEIVSVETNPEILRTLVKMHLDVLFERGNSRISGLQFPSREHIPWELGEHGAGLPGWGAVSFWKPKGGDDGRAADPADRAWVADI